LSHVIAVCQFMPLAMAVERYMASYTEW